MREYRLNERVETTRDKTQVDERKRGIGNTWFSSRRSDVDAMKTQTVLGQIRTRWRTKAKQMLMPEMKKEGIV